MKVGELFCFQVMSVVLICGCVTNHCRRDVYALSNISGSYEVSGKSSFASDYGRDITEYRFMCDQYSTVSNLWRFVESIPQEQRADLDWTISCDEESAISSFMPGDDYDILVGSIPPEACCIIKVLPTGDVEETSCYRLNEIEPASRYYPSRRYYILPAQEIRVFSLCQLIRETRNRHPGLPIEFFVKPLHCRFRSCFCRENHPLL